MSSTHLGREAGFTLLELLVALTLLALLSLVLFGGLRFGRQVWQTAEVGISSTNAVRAFQDEIRRDIARAQPVFIDDPLQPRIDFDGAPSQLTLLAPAHDGSGGLERLVIASDGKVTTIAGRPELAVGDGATYVKTLKGAGSLRFAYYGILAGEKAAAWHGEWHRQTRLPLLIRVDATADKGAVWPLLVVSPHIAADPSCVYDPGTGFCHGR